MITDFSSIDSVKKFLGWNCMYLFILETFTFSISKDTLKEQDGRDGCSDLGVSNPTRLEIYLYPNL